MAKYDWVKLEREFTSYAKYAAISLREFAREKGIPYGENLKRHTKGWLDKRASKRIQKSLKIEEEMQLKEISREVAANERHIALWDRLAGVIEESLDKQGAMQIMCGTDNLNAALNRISSIIDRVQKGQRLALGMDKEQSGQKGADENAITSLMNALEVRKVEGVDDAD